MMKMTRPLRQRKLPMQCVPKRKLGNESQAALLLLPLVWGAAGWSVAADVKAIDFAHDVVPILNKHCVECHGGDEAKGGMSLNTRSTLLDAAAVEPGDADASRLIELVTSADPEDQMPPADRDRLSAKQIAVLRKWIDAGAPWEEGFTFAETRYEPPLGPRRVELPPAVGGRTNPIDRILDAYRAQRDLPQPPSAGDAMFMRRLSLDVVGLLPEADEMRVFLADDRPDKRQRLIERTLEQDHAYAEHWLTFWSDLLRNTYAGTGFIDDGRKQITEWLYAALLTNKPYDQFVRELIAPEPEAAGFVRGIKWRGNVNSSQATEIQFAQSLGQVFLGINMKCASCHDSFIDRWTLDETYNLAAVYAQAPLEVHRCDVPTGRLAEAAWIFPELGEIDASAEQPQRLEQLAELLTHPENGRLTRTIVNRIWQRMMGRGIVHPVDAMQTRPWSADLLDFLAMDLRDHGYDLKHTIGLIAGSQAYQSAADAVEEPASPEHFVFTGPLAKRMTAEQFLDAIRGLSETWPAPDAGAFQRDGRGQGGQLAAILRATETAHTQTPLERLVNESLLSPVLAQSHWVWSHPDAAEAPPKQVSYFRLPVSVDDAAHVVVVVAVDGAAKVFVNGHPLAKHRGYDKLLVAEATQRLMEDGSRNLITVRAENDGDKPNPAGLMLSVAGLSEQGELLWLASARESAVIEGAAPDGWELPEFDDSAWSPATVLGKAAREPWKLTEKFDDKKFTLQRDWDALWGDRPLRASLSLQDGLQATLGRPNREQVVTTRPSGLTTLEAISLANGVEMAHILHDVARDIQNTHAETPDELIDWLYLSALSRMPTAAEANVAQELLGLPLAREGIEDLLWAVVMLPEFQLIR